MIHQNNPMRYEPESTPLSNCHKAPTELSGGIGDFSDHDEVVTMSYICSSCKQPCDLYEPEENELDVIFGKWRYGMLGRALLSPSAANEVDAEAATAIRAAIAGAIPERPYASLPDTYARGVSDTVDQITTEFRRRGLL